MWGVYPAVIPSSRDNQIERMIYAIASPEQFKRLEEYETLAYTWCDCTFKHLYSKQSTTHRFESFLRPWSIDRDPFYEVRAVYPDTRRGTKLQPEILTAIIGIRQSLEVRGTGKARHS
jgi:hypothetical protein